MRTRLSRSPWRALRPLAALTALALMLGLAAPVAAAQAPLRITEVTDDGAQLKFVPPGVKVSELRSIAAYDLDGMALPTEAEPNDTPATANPLASNEVVLLGTINPAVDVDWFSFSALAGDRVTAATMTAYSNGGSGDTVIDIFASDGVTVLETDDENGSFNGNASVTAGTLIPTSGTYYVRVDGFSASSLITPYHVHIRVQSGSPVLEVEPNNDTATAMPLPASGWTTGNISAVADPDLFSFALNAGDTVFVALDMDPERAPANTNWNGRVGVGIFGGFFLLANDSSTVKPHAEAFFMTAKDAGTYYAYVDSAVATGLGANARYNLSVRIIPKQVQTDCTIIPSSNVPVTLGPGVDTATSTIVVPPTITGSINDVNVLIDLAHGNMVDLDVSLTSPAATVVPLFTDIGTAASLTMNLGLDENAGMSATTFTSVTGMIYQPEAAVVRLSNLNGQSAAGTWTLSLTDDLANAIGGTLNNWSLEICGTPPPPHALTMTKTVGVDPGVCATTTSITVAPGTTVYYCYTATNVGLNTLTTHDLVDSELGTIFTALPFALAPGSSIDTVTLGQTISSTLTTTTTNTATWTGHDGANTASDGASATVNVPTHCGPGLQEVTVTYSHFAGTFPPAGWTLANTSTGCLLPGLPDWTNTNPGLRTNLTGGAGPFAIADSDSCGSGSVLDATIASPVLDLTGLTDPIVHYATDYDDIGATGDNAVLEVSTDGGATFTPLLTWDEDHRGPLAIDQAIPGAGENDVIVRWHYVNGTWDWWWQLDDAMVIACEPVPVASISMSKTVGLVSGVCGVDETLTVPFGTPVTYCYTVTNTGGVTLNYHTVVDDQLGTVLDNLNYVLAPAASTFFTVDDVVLTDTTTNNATWTASESVTSTTVCSSPALAIPDGVPAGVNDAMVIASGGNLSDLNISLDVSHTWVGDVAFTLTDGTTTAAVFDRPGVPASTFGCDGDNVDAVLDDSGATPVETECGAGTPSITGTFSPNVALAGFNGAPFAGTWTLNAADFATPDPGTLNEWCLTGTFASGSVSASDSVTVTVEPELLPDISVNPTSLSSFQSVDTEVDQNLDITNSGDADLDWTITEDAGLVANRAVAQVPGRQQPILPHYRTPPPAANAVSSGDHTFSRSTTAVAGERVLPRRGDVPDATVTLSHSVTQTIVTGNSVACTDNVTGFHVDNSYIRAFDLPAFGISGGFAVTQIEIGIEEATGTGGTQPSTVNLYTWDPLDPFTFANFVLIGTANALVPDQAATIITIPVTGSAPAGSNLVVEFFTPDGVAAGHSLFVGSNPDGQTAPTFLAAAGCGIAEPTDVGVVGFPNMHLVMNVTGTTGCDVDLVWISASPAAGTTVPTATTPVTVTFDSTGLIQGATYTGSLCILSNDPDTPELLVPVTLEVDGMDFSDGFETGDASRWSASNGF